MSSFTAKFVLFFFVFFSAQKMEAQRDFTINGQVSPTFSWLKSKNPYANGGGTKLGIDLGVTGEYWETRNFALTMGAHLLLGHGGNITYDSTGNNWSPLVPDTVPFKGKTTLKMNYLSLPLGFKYQSKEVKKFQFWGEFQPLDIWILISTKGSADDLGVSKVGVRKIMNPLALGWQGGLGANYRIPKTDLKVIGGLCFGGSWTSVKKKRGDDAYKTALGFFRLRLGIYF